MSFYFIPYPATKWMFFLFFILLNNLYKLCLQITYVCGSMPTSANHQRDKNYNAENYALIVRISPCSLTNDLLIVSRRELLSRSCFFWAANEMQKGVRISQSRPSRKSKQWKNLPCGPIHQTFLHGGYAYCKYTQMLFLCIFKHSLFSLFNHTLR